MKQLLKRDNEVKVIGTRHGEKLYESLVSREEMARSQDLGGYYRIPADSRDLNYNKYFIEGRQNSAAIDDYTSHNTHRLDIQGASPYDLTTAVFSNIEFLSIESGTTATVDTATMVATMPGSMNEWFNTYLPMRVVPLRSKFTAAISVP